MNKTILILAILVLSGCTKYWKVQDRNPEDASYWALHDAMQQAAQPAQHQPQPPVMQQPQAVPAVATTQAQPVEQDNNQQKNESEEEEKEND